jgi:hypothetical protein
LERTVTRRRVRAAFLGLAALVCTSAKVQSQPSGRPVDTVSAFYRWTLSSGRTTEELQPRVVRDSTGAAIALDDSTLPRFKAQFMASGLFAPEFTDAIDAYYDHHKVAIAKSPGIEDGPVLETEDMDIFFCAQEYEYTSQFIDGMKVVSESVVSNVAELEVQSPYGWKTHFRLRRIASDWRISGYCVFSFY